MQLTPTTKSTSFIATSSRRHKHLVPSLPCPIGDGLDKDLHLGCGDRRRHKRPLAAAHGRTHVRVQLHLHMSHKRCSSEAIFYPSKIHKYYKTGFLGPTMGQLPSFRIWVSRFVICSWFLIKLIDNNHVQPKSTNSKHVSVNFPIMAQLKPFANKINRSP